MDGIELAVSRDHQFMDDITDLVSVQNPKYQKIYLSPSRLWELSKEHYQSGLLRKVRTKTLIL